MEKNVKQYRNKTVDANGQVIFQSNYALELLYQNQPLDKIFEPSIHIEKYNQFVDIMDLDWGKIQTQIPNKNTDLKFIKSLQQTWLIPESYQKLDVESWVLKTCENEEQLKRCQMELEIFKKMNWIPVLQTLKYLVDTMREQNIVWGVGRGSSVSSYVLYKIGIHKIDSIKYQLDFNEFAKFTDQ